MLIKLKRRHIAVLAALSDAPNPFVKGHELPNGSGQVSGGHCASAATLRELLTVGFVERDESDGYAITCSGMEALSESRGERIRRLSPR